MVRRNNKRASLKWFMVMNKLIYTISDGEVFVTDIDTDTTLPTIRIFKTSIEAVRYAKRCIS